MTIQVIRPNEYAKNESLPFIFLAGPIKSVNNWQDEAIGLFDKLLVLDAVIATPRSKILPLNDFNNQIDWETKYLNLAGKTGVILFWLANEQTHFCERAFAQTTRFELGEWLAKSKTNGASIVVGIDTNFSGAGYLSHRIRENYSHVPLVHTLKDAINTTILQLLNK